MNAANGQWAAALVALLAVGGQALNLYLNLKLRAALAEQKDVVLDQVAVTYKRKDVCASEMLRLEERGY